MQKYAEISLDKKQEILQEYQPGVRGKGFKALAKQYELKAVIKQSEIGTKSGMEPRNLWRKRVVVTGVACSPKKKKRH